MKKYLSNFNFNEHHLEKLADLLIEMNSSKTFNKSVKLLDLVDEISNSYSFERNNKKNKNNFLINKALEKIAEVILNWNGAKLLEQFCLR